jgi:translation initiation factor IF-2
MAGKRVHQLAKELEMSSKELLHLLQSMGEDITNPLSSVSEDLESSVRKKITGDKPAKAKTTKAKTTKAKTTKADKKPAKTKAKAAKVEKKPAAKKTKKETAEKKQVKKKEKPSAPKKKETTPETTRPKKERSAAADAEVKKKPKEESARPEAGPKARPGKPSARRPRQQPPPRHRGGRRQPPAEKPAKPREPSTKPMKKKLRIPAGISVRDFAQKVGRTPSDIIAILMSMGEMITINQSISEDAMLLVAEELGMEIEVKTKAIEEAVIIEDEPESLQPRAPVVTVMGHVDHGKTSLLDAIRDTTVTEKEMGGITQHIGASVVEFEGKEISFIDTPGHESFTALRARGAQVTDIAVLVVAADDGVMPQTIEAIDHARAAEVPIMVAVNKIDKPEADLTKVRQQLTEFNLLPEEWGGETVFVDVSATEGTNLDHLLEMILLLAEMNDYRANPAAPASGNIIEARLDKGRGPVATLIVKRGTLKRGDPLVAGGTYGKVRALLNDKGQVVQEAGPSTPVEILGLNRVPQAGDEFMVVEDEKKARAIADSRITKQRAEDDKQVVRSLSLEDLFEQLQEGEIQEFNLIIKGDTQGSVEAVKDSVDKMKIGDISINVIATGVGAITENDIMLARASGAVVIGFNVRPDPKARDTAANEKIDIRTYRVIYQLLEELEAALVGMLKPEYEEVQAGLLEVKEVFRVPRLGAVAGVLVKEGEINRKSQVRLLRDGSIVYEGAVASLRRFKDDVRSVSAGYECGVGLEDFQDIKEGDVIEVIEMREIPRESEATES